MKIKIVIAIAGLVLLGVNGMLAQIPSYSEEALMFSRILPGGSARMQGMGGVQNSVGGDVSSAYYNPAGLGMYNRSDFAITPGYSINNSSASYLGNTTTDSKTKLIIPNLGIAFQTKKNGNMGFLSGTFAVNYNRTNSFNNTFTYKGTNKDNSIIDYFIDKANGTGTSQFSSSGANYNTPTGLAYFNYLIGPQSLLNPSAPSDQYFTDVSGIPVQEEVVKTSGSQSQWSFSYGANFNDKIFVGGGIGIASFNYKSENTYTETFNESNQPMSPMQLNETLSLSGSGINATLGTIIRPVEQFQIGLSFATPTSYAISDTYTADMSTAWKNFEYTPGKFLNNKSASTDIVTSNYNLTTPWRVSGGFTFFFQKKGFISADAEWLSYGNAHYSSSTGDDYSEDNKKIKNLYQSTVNIKVGGEYRFNNYRFRAGYSMMPDPFQAEQNGVSHALSSYSAGLGYRTTNFYIDFAAVLGQGNSSYRPYTVNTTTSPLVTLNNKTTTFIITVGFPF